MIIKLNRVLSSSIGIGFLLLAMYSIGTISSISVSWRTTLLLLGISVGALIINHLAYDGNNVSCTVGVWAILTALCSIGVVLGDSKTVLIFYILCLVLLLLSETISIDALLNSLKWMKYFGLVFALGCYWQYLFPNQYYDRLFPLFGPYYQQSIRRQFTFHKMCTGFTSQTAVTAQFIVLGLMAVIYTYSLCKTRKAKIILILEAVILGGGLLLTGKRSPLLNLAAGLIVVDMITVKRSKKGNRILGVALGVTILLLLLYFLAPLLTDSRNSVVRFLEFTSLEDIGEASNGRLTLYSSAISEFMKKPVFGIGWGKFSDLYEITGVHNIYLQLLCECGLCGFALAIFGIVFALGRTIRMLKSEVLKNGDKTVILLKCSVFIQIYILVYGLFGNPLYDQNYMIMYCFGILLSTVVELFRKNQRSASSKNSS